MSQYLLYNYPYQAQSNFEMSEDPLLGTKLSFTIKPIDGNNRHCAVKYGEVFRVLLGSNTLVNCNKTLSWSGCSQNYNDTFKFAYGTSLSSPEDKIKLNDGVSFVDSVTGYAIGLYGNSFYFNDTLENLKKKNDGYNIYYLNFFIPNSNSKMYVEDTDCSNKHSSKSSMQWYYILLIVVGCILITCAIIVLIYFLRRKTNTIVQNYSKYSVK